MVYLKWSVGPLSLVCIFDISYNLQERKELERYGLAESRVRLSCAAGDPFSTRIGFLALPYSIPVQDLNFGILRHIRS